MRSHYMGRTFIEPSQQIRHFGVKLKLSPVREVLNGKRVVVVDDSIVRGTTSRKIVEMIRGAGAREVHMRISSPPTDGSLPLRHRHADARGADRLVAHASSRSASSSAPIRSATCRWTACTSRSTARGRRAPGRLLRRLLLERLPDHDPAAGAPAPAAADQRLGRRRDDDDRDVGRPSSTARCPTPRRWTRGSAELRRRFPRAIIDRYLATLPDGRRARADLPGRRGGRRRAARRGRLGLVRLRAARRSARRSPSARAPTSRTARSSTSRDDGPCDIGADCIIGHRAMIHACRIEDACLIGMQATDPRRRGRRRRLGGRRGRAGHAADGDPAAQPGAGRARPRW